ncbi:hypothetical protein K227x_14060 [Rubripirellula lacrimiformis]|uniref:Uncharacterized protein n=1 Tax=Rubripirellula lacrimiformis TaxID=1930273 RepID=A0A517N796_9BACT|nr:hypothetical protein [Rubripirellula lacrimiformis]QDT03027.1 hypothetical protein K227x_14060 [Rubripirellula lacrimiformis]
MIRSRQTLVRIGHLATAVCTLVMVFPPGITAAGEPLGGIFKAVSRIARGGKEAAIERHRPDSCTHQSVEELAGQLDWLEHHIDCYGSVVPKQPDVWGEARMTSHRHDIEEQLGTRLKEFGPTLQGAIRRSDQSALALALQAQQAVSPASASPVQGQVALPALIESQGRRDFTSIDANRFAGQGLAIEPVKYNAQLFRYLNALNELRRINEGDDTADGTGYAMNLVRLPISVLPGSRTRTGYGCEVSFTAEPILGDDLLPNTFRSLVINDVVDMHALPVTRFLSDDLVDSVSKLGILVSAERRAEKLIALVDQRLNELRQQVPFDDALARGIAYAEDDREYLQQRFQTLSYDALSDAHKGKQDRNLPVLSGEIVFDGQKYQVEAKLSAEQILKSVEDLLIHQATIQSLDLVLTAPGQTQKTIPVSLGAIEDFSRGIQRRRLPYIVVYPKWLLPILKEANIDTTTIEQRQQTLDDRLGSLPQFAPRLCTFKASTPPGECGDDKTNAAIPWTAKTNSKVSSVFPSEILSTFAEALQAGSSSISSLFNAAESFNSIGSVSLHSTEEVLRDRIDASTFTFGSTSPIQARRIRRPLAPSQYLPVVGYESFGNLTESVAQALLTTPPNDGNFVLVSDVRSILKEELAHTYDMLSQPSQMHLWATAGPQLAEAVTTRNFRMVRQIREQFLSELGVGVRYSPTSALAWSIMIESSLLNRELVAAMRRLESEKGCGCGWGTDPMAEPQFCGANPSAEARQAFNQYVQCRWPIQVFALDPTAQEQNIADSFNLRRELQLAAAVAISTGNASVRAAGAFARQLEIDIDTIEVNATEVAFAHGAENFGWRFYPRLQSPDTASTLQSFGQTLFGGPSRDRLLSARRLEPGQRECTAVIVMPSFVPYVHLHSRTSWFRLTHPSDRELTLTDSMQLSRASEAVHRFAQCVPDCDCYRPADVAHLSNTARQLSSRLPLQSAVVGIPYENSLGGFELISGGMNNLSVELTSWYGAPGIDPKHPTVLFLVGDGFSVHETQVIVGGRTAEFELMSRQIMKVVVPAGVQKLGRGEGERLVDVHVATPYGVSSHLLIPLNEPEPKPAVTAQPNWNPAVIPLAYQVSKVSTTPKVGNLAFVGGGSGGKLAIQMPSKDQVADGATVSVQLMTDTPLGLAIASGAPKAFALALTANPDKSQYELADSQIATFSSQLEKAVTQYVLGSRSVELVKIQARGVVSVGEQTIAIEKPLILDVHVQRDPSQ